MKCRLIIYIWIIVSFSSIVLANPLDYTPKSDGYVEILAYNGDRIARLGFGVVGSYFGVGYVRTSLDYAWDITKEPYLIEKEITKYYTENESLHAYSVNESYLGYNITASNNHAFNWTININDDRDRSKILHRFDNNLGDLTNTMFYYIFEVPDNSYFLYDGRRYIATMDKQLRYTGNLNSIQNIRINGYNLVFSDIIDNGFNVSDLYIGDGSKIGFYNKLIFALGITKGSGSFPEGLSVTIDPTISDYIASSAGGDPHADFTNSANAGLSDNNYARSSTPGDNVSIYNFSILESEGGSVPDNSIIQAIRYEVEAKVEDGLGSPSAQLIGYSSHDFGVTLSLDPVTHNIDQIDPEGFYFFGGTQEMGVYAPRRWMPDELNNTNFQIVASISNSVDGGTLYVDSGKVKIVYADNATLNITERLLGNIENWYALPISDQVNVSFDNIIYYYAFEELVRTELINESMNIGLYDLPVLYYGASGIRDGYIGNALELGPDGDDRAKPAFHEFQSGRAYTGINNFTMMAWVYFDGGAVEYIFDKSSASNPASLYEYYVNRANTNRIQFRKKNESGATEPFFGGNQCITPNTADGKIVDGVWKHLAVSYDGSESRIYIDGALQVTCTYIKGPLNNIGSLTLGGRSDASDSLDMDGAMDEFMFFNPGISGDVINSIYKNQSKQVYNTGELVFTDINISTGDTIDVTINSTQPADSVINITIGSLSGGSYVYGEEYRINDTYNGLNISTSHNFSYKFKFYSGKNSFITPSMSENITIYSYNRSDCIFTEDRDITISADRDCYTENLVATGNKTLYIKANITNIDRIVSTDRRIVIDYGLTIT